MSVTVGIKKLHPDARIPVYATPGSAGLDLCTLEAFVLRGGSGRTVKTGLSVAIPEGFEGQVRSRSGLASKFAVAVLNSPGTIDCDYRGEVCVLLYNHSDLEWNFKAGDRIAQLVICPVVQARLVEDENLFTETERGAGGFGSTGK